MSNKTLRGNVTIFVAKDEAFASFTAPTAAELNDTDYVTIISSAVNDDYEMNPTDSDTDNSQSVVDVALIDTPTFPNYSVDLSLFRDADITASGVYNAAFALFKNSGIPLIVGKRVGVPQATAFAANQIISMFKITTDNPTDILDKSSPMQLKVTPKARGAMLVEYKVLS